MYPVPTGVENNHTRYKLPKNIDHGQPLAEWTLWSVGAHQFCMSEGVGWSTTRETEVEVNDRSLSEMIASGSIKAYNPSVQLR